MSLLTVKNLNTFRAGYQVLINVSLTVAPGEIVFIYGRNGAGKTTLLSNIMGVVPATFGSIVFKGQELVEEERNPENPTRIVNLASTLGIGWVPEDKRIFPNLTTLENLKVGIKPRGPTKPWNLDNIFYHFPSLEKLLSRQAYFLSGGEKQLLSFARALMGNPELLLLDEPSEGLSPAITQIVAQAILKLRDLGIAIIIADQNLKFIEKFQSRMYFMHLGATKFAGSYAQFEEERTSGKLMVDFL